MKKNILLSDFTTIGLGGSASFMSCKSVNDILSAVNFAKKNYLDVQVIGEGSNIIFSDNGFAGLVIKIDLNGIKITEEERHIVITAAAGENWDDLVKLTVDKGISGIECLSGIPGSVGATPIQNVGAYGQEVKNTIFSVKAIDINTLENISFANSQCNFGYRDSRFKSGDHDRYIITEVTFRFEKNREPEVLYEQLQKYLGLKNEIHRDRNLHEKLSEIRNGVIELRRSKSMIIDKDDPNSKSCGSFFTNPVLSEKEFNLLNKNSDPETEPPFFKTGINYKIPAAWLVEQTGFSKGFVKNGVGISKNHSLALININGTTRDLLLLADDIEKKVMNKFNIRLIKEPVIV